MPRSSKDLNPALLASILAQKWTDRPKPITFFSSLCRKTLTMELREVKLKEFPPNSPKTILFSLGNQKEGSETLRRGF